jgi:hypothetical protein
MDAALWIIYPGLLHKERDNTVGLRGRLGIIRIKV